MKNLILTAIAVCSLNTIQAQEISYKKWVKEAPRLEDSFFTTPKAKEVAETVLLLVRYYLSRLHRPASGFHRAKVYG